MGNANNSDKTGLLVYDGTDSFVGRTLTAGTGISITNGDGVSGNPTIDLSASSPNQFTTDSGIATPTLNNLNVLGGTGITTSGSGSTLTVTEDGSVITTSYLTDSGTATPSGGMISILGSGSADTSGSGNTITINNSGGGSGAWTLLDTQTASASASIEFTGLSSTYFYYFIYFTDVRFAATGDMRLRTSSDNGVSFDSGASDYVWTEMGVNLQAGTSVLSGDNADSEIELYTTDSASNDLASGELIIFNPSSSNHTRITGNLNYEDQGGQAYRTRVWGARLEANIVDAIQFTCSGGNITSGTFKLYGVTAS